MANRRQPSKTHKKTAQSFAALGGVNETLKKRLQRSESVVQTHFECIQVVHASGFGCAESRGDGCTLDAQQGEAVSRIVSRGFVGACFVLDHANACITENGVQTHRGRVQIAVFAVVRFTEALLLNA